MREAYNSPDGVILRNGVLYVAGTRSPQDVACDLLIPLGLTSKIPRYSVAESYVGRFHTVYGHSMGGSIALELQRRHPGIRAITDGAPVVSFTPSPDRHRTDFDPISALDFGAVSRFNIPHTSDRRDFSSLLPFARQFLHRALPFAR